MSKPTFIENSPNGGLIIHMDDGSRLLASQLTNGNWIASEKKGGGGGTPPTATGWRWPFPARTITDPYGDIGWRFHNGTDFGNPPATAGAKIQSIGSGTVRSVGLNDWWGNWCSVDHGVVGKHGRLTSIYCHQDRPPVVKVGQKVDYNTVLGYVGDTGDSKGAHLHLVLAQNGTEGNEDTYDPAKFLKENNAKDG